MTPEVDAAIQEIQTSFPSQDVAVEPDGEGGAHIIVQPVDLGDRYRPTTTWVGFQIPFQYPRADVYPHFVDAGLLRSDQKAHGAGISAPTTWRGRTALQVSRRSPRWDCTADSAAGKLLKIIGWLRSL